ncbi:MAG: CapA family protein [Thermomicrobiales bacterium]|nr:CapA family protein [Thermomicrobiales bacterium]
MTESTDHVAPRMPALGAAQGRRPFSRRALMIGAAPVVAAALGAAGSIAMQLSQSANAPAPETPAAAPQAAATPPVAAATPKAVATPTSTAIATPVKQTPGPIRALPNMGVPEGMALVASPRLPLPGVGPEDPWRLLTGRITNWGAVGSAVPLPVRTLALRSQILGGTRPDRTFDDYDALAETLASDPGAVALVPADLIDFRVQALTVGEEDPFRAPIGGARPVRIGVIGDIVPGRNVHLHMEQYGDFTRPFLRVAPLLRSFDLTIANLEGNLSDTLPQPTDPHSFSFVSNPAMVEGMTLAGIDALTLANNHTVWNSEGWGVQGLLDTIGALEAAGMPYFGGGRDLATARAPFVTTVGGTRIAFLGIDGVTANYEVEPGVANGVLDFDAGATGDRPGTNPYLAWQVNEDIAAATKIADVVIPYFHFGAEYIAVPPSWATAASRVAIDAGATAVVTNHPHLVQGMERYAGKPIVYSPGNFILDQMWAAEVRSGLVLEIDLVGSMVRGLRFHGVEIEDFHQPRPMTAGEHAAIMDRFWAATDRRAARDGDAQSAERSGPIARRV